MVLNNERATFSPVVMSYTGRLSLLANKWHQPYSSTMYWFRCRLSFSLLMSSIQAIRGSRSSAGKAIRQAAVPPIGHIIVESLLPLVLD